MSGDYQNSAPVEKGDADEFRDAWERARKRWQLGHDVDDQNRKDAAKDIRFVWEKGAQWPEKIRLSREAEDRPCLEINQLPQYIKHVVNDERENRPAIRVRPVSNDATKEIADIYEGHVRQIEYQSRASAVYDRGFEQAVTCGRGYWRVCTEYVGDMSFDQTIRLRSIPDPLSVILDPNYQEPDASDIEWGFVLENMTRDEFKSAYPKAQPLDWEGSDTEVIQAKWYDGENKVIVADYFEKVYSPRTLVQLSNGAIGWKDKLGEPDEVEGANALSENAPDTYGGLTILAERESRTCRVDWYKVYGGGVLEKYDWAGKYIPIIVCIGDETMVDGKRIFQGLIRRALDVQTMFNFWETRITENLALAPNAQWLVPDGAIEGYENVWNEANLRLRTRLPYKHSPNRPAPNRIDPAVPPSGMLEQVNQCRQDFYTTIGIYPPTLAKESNEDSGIAINYRQHQADRGTYHFADNLARAIEHTGRIICDLIPKIIDTERDVMTTDEENKQKPVRVNVKDPVSGYVRNNLAAGEYAVVVDTGPSFATRRMEAAKSMLEFLNVYPAAGPLVGDLIARNSDWADSDKVAARLQMMLPPTIQMMEAQANGDPKYAALAAALQQANQAAQQQGMQFQQQMQFVGQKLNEAKAQLAQVKLSSAKQALAATVAAHNADTRAEAENQRTGIEGYRADTERLSAVLDFLSDMVTAQQKQIAPVGPEAVQIERQTRPAVAGANLQ